MLYCRSYSSALPEQYKWKVGGRVQVCGTMEITAKAFLKRQDFTQATWIWCVQVHMCEIVQSEFLRR